MTAFQLLEPPASNLDLAILGIDAIADDEMVRQAVFHPSCAVFPVVNGGIAIFGAAMVGNNPPPSVRGDDEFLRAIPNRLGKVKTAGTGTGGCAGKSRSDGQAAQNSLLEEITPGFHGFRPLAQP